MTLPKPSVIMQTFLHELELFHKHLPPRELPRVRCDIHPCEEEAVASYIGWNVCEAHEAEMIERRTT